MQSYLYRNEERIKGTYAQIAGGLVTKTSAEKSSSVEGGLTASVLSLFTPSLKGTKGGKTSTETLMKPENMVATLVQIIPETGKTKRLGQRKVRHDLRLKGQLAERYVEIPFSSNWVTGPSQFTMLCHAIPVYVLRDGARNNSGLRVESGLE
jgi:hypothetical protein